VYKGRPHENQLPFLLTLNKQLPPRKLAAKAAMLMTVAMAALLLWAPPLQAADLYVGQGLLPVRNYQPILGLSLQMSGDSAIPLRTGEFMTRLHVAETSTILQEVSSTGQGLLKLNQLRSALELRYGVLSGTEVGLELASLYNHSGGLDGMITATEHLFDRPAPIRERLKRQGFAYMLSRNGQTLLQGTNGAYGVTDMVLSAKTLLVAEKGYVPAIAVRLMLKVPIGDKDRTFSNDVFDVGIGLLLQKTLFTRFVLYQNLNEVFPTGRFLGTGLRAYFTSITGLEFMATPKFSITGQFEYYQSPFNNTGLKLLDEAVTEGVLAFGYRFTPRLLWQLYGIENIDYTRDVAADFTLGTALTYRFGR
jgi:hypothetical protein